MRSPPKRCKRNSGGTQNSTSYEASPHCAAFAGGCITNLSIGPVCRGLLSRIAITRATLPSHSFPWSCSSSLSLIHISIKIKIGKWRKVISWTLSRIHIMEKFVLYILGALCTVLNTVKVSNLMLFGTKNHPLLPFHKNCKWRPFYLYGLANGYISNWGLF